MNENSNPARVETMTATVEVLKMGERQITAGVYRQLDLVPLDAMEPFGRVNLKIADGSYHLVGRHRETGALVRHSFVTHWSHLDDQRLNENVRSSGPSGNKSFVYEKEVREWLRKADLPLIVLAGR